MSSSPPSRRARQREAKSLQLTQRVILSVIVAVVFGSFSAVLAAYLAVRGDQDLPHFSVVGLWIMSGVMGLPRLRRSCSSIDGVPIAPGCSLASCQWRSRLPGFWGSARQGRWRKQSASEAHGSMSASDRSAKIAATVR